MSNHCEFDNSLGHACADADILNAFKPKENDYNHISGTASRKAFQALPNGKRFRTSGTGTVNDKQV